MTREDQLRKTLAYNLEAAGYLALAQSARGKGLEAFVSTALAFADAEAAAMRERAAVAADTIADIARTNGAEFVAAGASASAVAIRALSVNEETVDG